MVRPPEVKMGKLAQKFNLGQQKRKHDQSHPVQSAGPQVLRRNDDSNLAMEPLAIAVRSPDGPRSRRAQSFGNSRPAPTECTAPALCMDIDNPEPPTPEQLQLLELEHRLNAANQRVRDMEDDAKVKAEELLVARTQARIDIDQEIIRLQQEVETLGEHEDRLIRELVSSESKLKGLRTTERDLKRRLSHFHTIYCLKNAYRDHVKKMNHDKQCTAKRLHDKFLEAETEYMATAFDLYEYLEANGLQETLPPDVKTWLAQSKGSKT